MRTEVRHQSSGMVVVTYVGYEAYENDAARVIAEHDVWVSTALNKRIVSGRIYTVQRHKRSRFEDADLARNNEIAIVTSFAITEDAVYNA